MSMALRVVTALMGGALTVLGLAVLPARAEAKPYPVRIESQPSGATVYLDSKEGDPLGQTPYTGKLAAGAHTLIIELDGYVSQVQDITIRRKRRVQRIAVRLSKIELATIEVVAIEGSPTRPTPGAPASWSTARSGARCRPPSRSRPGRTRSRWSRRATRPSRPGSRRPRERRWWWRPTWRRWAARARSPPTKGAGVGDADPDDVPDEAEDEEERAPGRRRGRGAAPRSGGVGRARGGSRLPRPARCRGSRSAPASSWAAAASGPTPTRCRGCASTTPARSR